MKTEAQKRANLKYRKEKVRQVSLSFYPSESDLIEWLEKQANKTGYIKNLIREDMKHN